MSATVIFDGDCGFCQQSVKFAKRVVKPSVQFVAYQEIDPASFGLTTADCQESLKFVAETKKVSSAQNAVSEMLRTAQFPWRLAGALLSLPIVNQLAGLIYRTIARNRHRLPGSAISCETNSATKNN